MPEFSAENLILFSRPSNLFLNPKSQRLAGLVQSILYLNNLFYILDVLHWLMTFTNWSVQRVNNQTIQFLNQISNFWTETWVLEI